jgi:hypothetical protein
MKIRTTRQATEDEAAAILEEIPRRQSVRAEVGVSFAKHFSPERLAEVFASLPVDTQRRVAAKCLVEPPVRRTLKFTRRRK